MTTSSRAIISEASAATINLWINRGLESLWLLLVVMVPLAFFSRDFAVSEAVISYVEVPKIALLRALTALMACLWLIKWAITGMQLNSSVLGLDLAKIRPSAWLPLLAGWLRASPGNWVVLAASFFLATTLLSTALSGSISVSLWGEIPGQDGYSAYTVAAYLVAFGVIATHLRTRPQVWRLMGAIVAMGTLVAAHGVLQHYGVDPFDLIEDTGGGVRRVSSFMGNTIFAAAVMSMTIPITLVVATVTVREPVWSADSIQLRTRQFLQELGLRAAWGLILAVQLLGIVFTLSRGPWVGTVTSLAIFAGLVLLYLGWRTFWRAAIVLGLASAFALAFLQSLASIFILGQSAWFGAVIALLAIGGVAVVIANWRYMGRAVIGVGLLTVVIAGIALGPSWIGNAGSALSSDGGQPVSNQQTTAGQVSERFSSISSDVRGGLIGGRGTHWRVSWELIRDRPWFEFESLSIRWLRPLVGYGPDLFRYTYLLRSPGEGLNLSSMEPDHAHNFFIHQAVEQGILGLISALGLFVASIATGAYQLLKRGRYYSNIHKLVLIGLVATIAGRSLEMLAGVARVSDLTVLWVLLALMAVLPLVMRERETAEENEVATLDPQQPANRRRNRRSSRAATLRLEFRWQPILRVSLVVIVLGAIAALTWTKDINYVRAAVAEGEGLKHVAQGELQDSLTSFDRAIELAPDVPLYHMNRSNLFFVYQINENLPPERGCSTQGELPYRVCLAAQSFQSNLNSVAYSPLYYRARLALANSAYNLRLDEEAIRFYQDSLSLVPSSWQIKNEVAEAYLEAGLPQDALPMLQESLAITQNTDLSSVALYLQGRAFRELGQFDDEAEALERALATHHRGDSASESIEVLEKYYSTLGPEAALNRLNESLRLDPKNSIAHFLRGQVLANSGKLNEAFEDFNQSIDLGYNASGVWTARGRTAQLLGRVNKAFTDLNRGVTLDPDNAEAFAFFSDFWRAAEFYYDAAWTLDRAIGLNPELAVARHFQGLLHFDLGLFPQAIEAFDHAISLDPQLTDSYEGRTEAMRQLELFANTSLATQEFADLSQSFSLDFDESEHFVWRGRIAQILGRLDDAIGYFRRAVLVEPENAEAHAYLGNFWRLGRSYELAERELKRAIDLEPESALVQHFLGLLNRDLERFPDVRPTP